MSHLMMSLIGSTLSWALVAFLVVDILRERCVPGTWRRYVYATCQWALAPPALVTAPFYLLFREDTLFWQTLRVINFILVLLCLRKLMNDDDDNWWRRKRKQLKRYLRSFGLQPSLVWGK